MGNLSQIGVILNWYKKAKEEKPQSFGWVSVKVPGNISKKMIKFCKDISKNELYTETGSSKYGIETDHHITVKYGIHSKNANEIKKILNNENSGEITLNKITMFDNDDYDVLKIDVKSNDLTRLNKKISNNTKITDSFPTYNPHITLAYLKKDYGKKYINNDLFNNMSFEFNKVIFEDSDDKKTIIKLNSIVQP